MKARWPGALVVVLAGVVAGVVPAPVTPTAGAAPPAGFWVAGDLHLHTTYSHDSYGGPGDDNTGIDEAYTLGHPVTTQFASAAARGLDFVAITDHNDVRSQSDDGWEFGGVLGLPAYENSLRGHAQMLGATTVYDNGDRSSTAVQNLADTLRADGGAFQINHPAGDTIDGSALDWSYGYDVAPDTLEAWNINAAWQPPAPSGNSPDLAISYWEGWLDRGVRVAATGGSDNHYLATSAIQGVGQPTTWVYVEELSVAGLVAGLRSGRTTISHQPPAFGGAVAYLEADAGSDGTYDAIVGDTVPADAAFRVRTTGASAGFLRLFSTGGVMFDEVPIAGPDFVHAFTPPAGASWVRAEIVGPDAASTRRETCDPLVGGSTSWCRDRLVLLAMTSALFVGP